MEIKNTRHTRSPRGHRPTVLGILLVLMAVVLLAACHNRRDDGGEEEADCYLTIYVYSPNDPIVTRSDIGYQDATDDENKVHKLQLWVFKHDGGELVGYLEAADVALSATASPFRMQVNPSIAEDKPAVDVYAVANAEAAGVTLSRITTRSELDDARMSGTHFAPTPRTTDVPSEGLPMTGVLKGQEINGSFPALYIGPVNTLATVRLARMVSKVRFLFCRGDDTDPAKRLKGITGVAINGNVIAEQEYLMLTEPFDNSLSPVNPLAANRYRIVSGAYSPERVQLGSIAAAEIPLADKNPYGVRDPKKWLYSEASYGSLENYIKALNKGVEDKKLLSWGTTYLRESDKRLTGVITYKTEADTDSDPDREVIFEMNRMGDFTRNHSWTVLVLFEGGTLRILNIVNIGVKEWVVKEAEEHEVYNW